jgi:hypothetical protein
MSQALEVSNALVYRTIIVDVPSRTILMREENGDLALLVVSIPSETRSAEQLCKAIYAAWGIHVLILNFLPACDALCGVIAELLTPMESVRELRRLPFNRFPVSLLPESDLAILIETIHGTVSHPFSRLGWIDQLITWLEKETGNTLSSKESVQQFNAGGPFTLLRLGMKDGKAYWLKATGEPNSHEFTITTYLSHHFADALPRLVAVREDWNAWLTEDMGTRLPDQPTAELLTRAAMRFASLQVRTIAHIDSLLACGAFNLRLPELIKSIDPIMEFLSDAMDRQDSTKVAPLSSGELRELTTVLWESCERMQSLGVPDTLIHNDLTHGNVLDDGTRCVFTDWSEAAVGNPFLSCERLCQLNSTHRESVQTAYRDAWSQFLYATVIDEAFAVMPLVAIYAYLFGRGDWIRGNVCDPRFESYARSLARHMYREAKNPLLLEALCH